MLRFSSQLGRCVYVLMHEIVGNVICDWELASKLHCWLFTNNINHRVNAFRCKLNDSEASLKQSKDKPFAPTLTSKYFRGFNADPLLRSEYETYLKMKDESLGLYACRQSDRGLFTAVLLKVCLYDKVYILEKWRTHTFSNENAWRPSVNDSHNIRIVFRYGDTWHFTGQPALATITRNSIPQHADTAEEAIQYSCFHTDSMIYVWIRSARVNRH